LQKGPPRTPPPKTLNYCNVLSDALVFAYASARPSRGFEWILVSFIGSSATGATKKKKADFSSLSAVNVYDLCCFNMVQVLAGELRQRTMESDVLD
jgi:hypothetical protein